MEFKQIIDKAFDKYQKSWKSTNNRELALIRLQLSAMIFGNEGLFEQIDKLEEFAQT